MIQAIHKATGGTARHVCSFGRPLGATFDWKLFKPDGSVVASAIGVVGTMPDTTAHDSSAKRGDRQLTTVASLAGGWRSLMIQPAAFGDIESLRSFTLPFQVGSSNTEAILFDPLPIDLHSGDRVVVNEVQVPLSSAVTSVLDAGIYFFAITATDEAGDLHSETTRLAITSANIVQPSSYSNLVRRYPALLDQGRPEDPDFSVSLNTALELSIETLERMGFDWWNLRTWDQLGPAVAARCAAQEFGAMGPDFDEMAALANDTANALIRDTVDALSWVDTDADGTPKGDRLPNVSRVWVNR